ncbi:MAG: methyltransferase domain-containing protein [Bacteroidota bacterium]
MSTFSPAAPVRLRFGISQPYASQGMKSNPRLARLVHRVFGYTQVGNYARSVVFRRALQSVPLSSFQRVLDLGCGHGEYAFMMANALPKAHVVALDIMESCTDSVKRAQRHLQLPNLEPFTGYLENYEGPLFDFIYSVDVFEHIAPDAMPFQAALERLKPGGYFLVKMPAVEQRTIFPERLFEEHEEWLEDEHIGQVYDANDLAARVRAEGFEVVGVHATDGLLSRLGWELGYFAKKGGRLLQLGTLPFLKGLVLIDNLRTDYARGNAIHVLARKPL